MGAFKVLGQRVPRIDALEKVTGRAQFAVDVQRPGMLYGAFLRSPHAHARIKSIDTSEAERMPGVKAVITQKSIGEEMAVTIEEEVHATRRVMKFFADEKVVYYGQKVAAVAAETREIAEEAVRRIRVEYEPLPAVTDVREAVQEGAPIILEHSRTALAPDGRILYNVVNEMHRQQGDVEQAFREADYIFEDTYVIPRVHQTHIEPQVAIAEVDEGGRVTVWTSTQSIFSVRSNIATSLRIPLSQVNVIGMTIGGGFGAKFGGIVDTYAVLLAMKTRRPVKIVYTREEEFLDGRPAPGLVITLRTGVSKEGKILVRAAYALWDVGVGGGVQWATQRILGVYDIPNFRIDSYEVNTNKPAPGAYRAPGSPQTTFASEAQLNRICDALGWDPVEFRLKNLKEGPEWGFKQVLTRLAEHLDWKNRTKGENEGWGIAIGEWTNANGPSGAMVSLHEDGTVHLFSGLMDLTGTDTAMAQIVAEVLRVDCSKVYRVRGDTASTPYAAPSGGSQATFSMGNAFKRAAEDALRKLLERAAAELETTPDRLRYDDGRVWVWDAPERSMTYAQIAQASLRRGGPIVGVGSFAHEPAATTISAQAVKVRVDPDTGQIQLLRYAGCLDVGRAINPMAVEGQMEGGTVQGISWGLMEEMLYSPEGKMWNPNLLDYRIPTTLDIPPLESLIVEVPCKHGPFGAKGVGEPPITPSIAALASAVADATGVWIHEVPLTPERVAKALRQAQQAQQVREEQQEAA